MGIAVAGPGGGHAVAGYRIHHGRVTADGTARRWLVADRPASGEVLGWHTGRVAGTTLHGLFESDRFRAEVLRWAADRAGKRWAPGEIRFAAARLARLDRIADTIEAHLDLDRLTTLIGEATA